MSLRILSVLSLTIIATAAAQAQESPQLPGPEKEHQWLHQFVGEWSTQSKAHMGPEQPAMESEGTISSRLIGGLWVLNEMKADLAGTPVVGIQTVGYDPSKKKYIGTWVDSMVNHMWHYEGTVNETGKVLTLEAQGPNFMADGKVTKYQDIYEFVSADEIAFSSRMQGADGKWVTFLAGTAKRR